MTRDSQRKKVYASITAMDKLHHVPLMSMTDVTKFVDYVLSRPPLVRRYGLALNPVTIKDGRHYSWACGGITNREGWITVPKIERTQVYVLRALAYVITQRHKRWRDTSGTRSSELSQRDKPWHGWEYCAVLMDLVRYGLGEEESLSLKQCYRDHRVAWTASVSRTLTPEQRETAKARGRELAAQMHDRKRRIEFHELNPEATLASPDQFDEREWETLYRIWK